jgi:hypothetical protein
MHQGGLTLGVREHPCRLGPWADRVRIRAWRPSPVEGGPRKIESTAGRGAAGRGGEFDGRCHELLSPGPFPAGRSPAGPRLFLNVDDDLGLLQFLVHLHQLGFQFAVLLGQWVAGRLAAALLGQRAESAGFAEPPPFDQVRQVQPLAPQQSADRARIGSVVRKLSRVLRRLPA